MPQGLPEFQAPPFGMSVENNGTTVTTSFTQMMSNMGSGIIVVPLIGVLENIAICKAFGKFTNQTTRHCLSRLHIVLQQTILSFFQQ